jgi:phenylacetate-coenzyme A ligase PaaK-like adenylate-forming protein
MNHVARTGQLDILRGVNLNLNFPSVVGTVKVGDRELEYGYSSGIYVKHTTEATPLRSLPAQGDIDALGGGKTIEDWKRRFELAYEQCKDEDVTIVGGVAPTTVDFGRYLHHTHGVYPKDLWRVRIMTLGSVPGINTKYQPILRALYGSASIAEIYGTTEGMFGQQWDEKRAWVPNYDLFLFEVETPTAVRMIYEMRPGETGSLVVSTPILPRYKIGDLIKAFEPPYFRCIGRDKPITRLRYWWDQMVTMDLGRL